MNMRTDVAAIMVSSVLICYGCVSICEEHQAQQGLQCVMVDQNVIAAQRRNCQKLKTILDRCAALSPTV
jgi:hypothetical protein